MKKTQNDREYWEKIFPELEIKDLEANNSALYGDQTMQSSAQQDLASLADINDFTWDMGSWANLTTSGLPSLTASDIYTIDFANIGNITTVNLSGLTASSAVWTSPYGLGNQATIKIDNQGVIDIPQGGDLRIGNVSLTERLDRIESRLAILRPNAELEKEFAELKALGDQYRALEQDIQERLKTFETLKRE